MVKFNSYFLIMLKLTENKIQVSWWDMSDIIKDLAEKIPFEVILPEDAIEDK